MENSLYENQTLLANGRYKTRFVFMHDDHFYRCFNSVKDIEDWCKDEEDFKTKKIKLNIIPISFNEDKQINVFVMDIESDEPVEYLKDLNINSLDSLDDVRYYTCERCNFQL